MGRLVAIVGRPNVGKSTLFNRLTQTRAAIVNDTSGTTRDRQYGKMEWNGMEMSVVDTGGWVVNSEDIFEEEINKQVHLAIDEADVILFVVDIKNGITDLDDHVADILRRTSKPVIVVANKDDNNQSMYAEAEFYALGLGKPFSISAVNGNGTGDLLDEVVKQMPEKAEETIDEELPRFAIVGRPNAGKSSLVNSLMDEQRNIVTDIAGTTRDSIYSRYNKFGFDFYLVDTAGIRKKNKVNEDIEYYSVLRSIRAIENSDVCILLIDATQVGRRREQDAAEHQPLRGNHPRALRPLHRLPHHLRVGTHQAAHPQGAADGHRRLQQPSHHHPHLATQQPVARGHPGLPAACSQGQVHQNQVHHHAQGCPRAHLHLLLQPAAVDQGPLQALPREQDTRALEPARHHHQPVLPREVIDMLHISDRMPVIAHHWHSTF